MRRTTFFLAAIVLAALLLAACGSDDGGHGDMPMGDSSATSMGMGGMGSMGGMDHGDNTPVVEGARRIEVTASSFAFDPAEITVQAGEDVAIVLTSDDVVHDFTVDELDTHVAAPAGGTAEGGLRADEPGRYTFYCTVSGHRAAGMEGTLIVE